MKKSVLVIALAFVGLPCSTNAQITQKLNVEKATVFLSGAEVKNAAKVELVKGENDIVFTNVAYGLSRESIIVNPGNGAIVEAVSFEHVISGANAVKYSTRARQLFDTLKSINARRKKINGEIATCKEQINILEANRKVNGSNNNLAIADVQKLLDFVQVRYQEYVDKKSRDEDSLQTLNGRFSKLEKILTTELEKENQASGELHVKLLASKSGTTNVTVSYNITEAGWTPTYDVFCDDIKSPLKLFYKANVFQHSGINWNNVQLALSTGNPQEGMEAPELTPNYIALRNVNLSEKPKAKSSMYILDGAQVSGLNTGEDAGELDAKKSFAPATYEQTISEHTAVNNAGVNTSFNIDLPYTIPGNGEEILVAIKSYSPAATYRYVTTPKLDEDVFLIAQVPGWQDLSLLNGETNLFYEGTYVGHGSIDPKNTKDTLDVSIGRDKKIVVTREQDKKMRSVKMIGSNVRQTAGYTITVRNTRNNDVNIMVKDQLPVSNDKDITLEDTETGGADYNEQTGMLTWQLTLKPNEVKKLSFGCTVKYPKGKRIEGLE